MSTSGNPQIKIIGKNFGSNDLSISREVLIGSVPCESTNPIDDTSILCNIPEFVGYELDVVVRIDGQSGTGSKLFSYAPPVVTR